MNSIRLFAGFTVVNLCSVDVQMRNLFSVKEGIFS